MLWYSTRGGACSGDIDGGYQVKENIHKIFEDWNETIVWSCLQGIMGGIHTNLSEDAAMAIIRFKPESSKRDFIIMVPRNAMWADLIEKCYKDKAEKVISLNYSWRYKSHKIRHSYHYNHSRHLTRSQDSLKMGRLLL